MNKRGYCLVAIAFFAVLAVALPVFAGSATEQIKETSDEILAIVSDPALKGSSHDKERRILIRKAVDKRFDWEEMSRRSLARHWSKRTEEEKKEFVGLFGQLLERTYLDKVEGYSGEKVEYVGESIDGEYGVVDVKIMTTKNEEIDVQYRLRKKDDSQWMVYDISVTGVSLVNNYRSQFNSILSKGPYSSLVERLKEKIAQD